MATAAFPLSVAEAEALAAVAEPDWVLEALEEAIEEVAAAVEEAAAELAARASAVALRVPHTSLVAQTD
jgi:hypothetical protein